MKLNLLKLTIFTSLMFSLGAQAEQPSSELKVKGTVGISSCTVIAPDDGIYDLGRISSSLVKPGTATTELPAIKKTWTINCDLATYLRYRSTDNRLDSASDTSSSLNHGLGNINGTGKIGFYTAKTSNHHVDGKSTLIYSTVVSGTGTGSNLYNNMGFIVFSDESRTAIAGKSFDFDVTISPILAGTKTMNGPITEDANIDGSTSINFSFGI